MSKKEIRKGLKEFHVASKHSDSQWIQRLEEGIIPCGKVDYTFMLIHKQIKSRLQIQSGNMSLMF